MNRYLNLRVIKKRTTSSPFSKGAGFTLIELLVVIAIIGLLASIVLVAVGPSRSKARDANRQSDVYQVNLAMEMCYNDDSLNCNGKDEYIDTEEGVDTVPTIGSYLIVPEDPTGSGEYQYKWTDGAEQYYCFYVKLETKANTWFCASNKGVIDKTDVPSYEPDNTDCCGPAVN